MTTDPRTDIVGKCRELSLEAAKLYPSLKVVRGHYHCPIWGERAHWWCVRPDGSIHDPTKDQFPSGGFGEYVEFSGMVTCANCGKELQEEQATIDGNGHYAFCSYACNFNFVM